MAMNVDNNTDCVKAKLSNFVNFEKLPFQELISKCNEAGLLSNPVTVDHGGNILENYYFFHQHEQLKAVFEGKETVSVEEWRRCESYNAVLKDPLVRGTHFFSTIEELQNWLKHEQRRWKAQLRDVEKAMRSTKRTAADLDNRGKENFLKF